MRMLVVGAAGLVGRSILGLESPHERIGLDRQALDVTHQADVRRAVRHHRPDVVFYCAGATDVDLTERDPAAARAVNSEGARFVAEGAREARALVVYVSSDYVFDGEKKSPYVETDSPRPLSAYGKSKLEGERYVREAAPDGFLIVRSAWLYGEGKGFPDFVRRQIEANVELRCVSDQVGSPTWAVDLAQALVALCERRLTGFFHFVNRGEAAWLDVARAVAELSGAEGLEVSSLTRDALGRPAPRPRYSVLDPSKFERAMGAPVRPWREALRSYLLQGGSRCAF